jgi:hypothetical protein
MSFWNGHQWEGVDTHPAAATSAKPESRTKRLAAAALEASLITALTFGLIAGSAFAAKGGNGGHRGGGGSSTGGSGTISLASPLVRDNNGNGTPNWGDAVRFNVSTTSTTTPWVFLTCYQGGSLVAQGSEGYFEGSLDDGNFGLYSPMWTSGAADCTAKLESWGGSVLGSTTFHVDA